MQSLFFLPWVCRRPRSSRLVTMCLAAGSPRFFGARSSIPKGPIVYHVPRGGGGFGGGVQF